MIILGHTIIGNGKKYIMVLHELMGDSRNYDPTHPFLDTNNFNKNCPYFVRVISWFTWALLWHFPAYLIISLQSA